MRCGGDSVSGVDWAGRRLHFIGIGGAGMSGLALVCARLGASVTGSDRGDSSYMERLRQAGLDPVVGHDAANLPPGAEVVVSTAIGKDNPELALAEENGIEPIHRGALLAQLCSRKRLIAIAGTHGKTTTTAMVVWALRALDADPAFFVGGEVPGVGEDGAAANAGWGEGEWVVAEADESDASFLRLRPEIAVVTNIEMDHHARWGSLEELTAAFARFVAGATGVVLPVDEELPVGRIREFESSRDVLYGEPVATRQISRFSEEVPGPAELELGVLGRHNVLNARAALAAIGLAGFDVGDAARALASFPGAKRRLEFKGSFGDTLVYDDYAHHPTEVRAALEALRAEGPDSLVAVFQPHLYSRTKEFATGFGEALALADEVIVLDVYPAREQPVGDLAGITSELVAEAIPAASGTVVITPETREEALEAMRDCADFEGQILVTIGAGDVFQLGEALLAEGS
jgi:UDP-N-acetylmuramate--alanine ligase